MKYSSILRYSYAKIILLMLLIILSHDSVIAGSRKIAGKVLDASTGEPLPGENVIVTHKILSNIPNVVLGAFYDVE